MHVTLSVVFDSVGAGSQDTACLFLLYPLNANANISTFRNKPQTQPSTSTFMPNSQTAHCPVGTWMCLVIAMNAQEPKSPLRAKAHVPVARCPWQIAGTDDR
jgi:hypothetical protein